MKWDELLNTDPLAIGALAGFVSVIVVTIGVFAFLLTRRNSGKASR